MLNSSILEKITMAYLDDTPSSAIDNQEQYIYSIMNNIERILNTRRGSVKHIPDYGLPDLSIIYQHLPSSLSVLQKYITFTLLKYEPRLLSIQIKILEQKSVDFIIHYELICQLKNIGYIRYATMFNSDEVVRVSL